MRSVPKRPVVLLSYFTLRDLGNLLDAVRRSGIAQQADVYIGSYGANPRTANAVHEEGTRYAPMLGLRTVLPKPLPSTAARRIAAGRAVGRSFRDKMGDSAETWQFDEISRLVTRSRATREFARGVLDGLHDDSLRGFVWLAHSAFGLASQPVDAELSAFWQTLSAAASHVVGEEFPPFAGDPVAAAHAMDAGRRALAAGGPVRRSLARRYQAGITPGYRLAPGLGGNVNHRSRAYVNSWRTRYLSARREAGLRDFAVFNFRFGNASPQVMNDVLRAVARVSTV